MVMCWKRKEEEKKREYYGVYREVIWAESDVEGERFAILLSHFFWGSRKTYFYVERSQNQDE